MAKAKITVTAQEQGVKDTLKAVSDLDAKLKNLESRLKSYDRATENAAMAEQRLIALTYKNATAIDAELQKTLNTTKARNRLASASTDLAMKQERLTALHRNNATALDVEMGKYLNQENAVNKAATAESNAVLKKEQAAAAIYKRNTQLEESVAKYLKESDAINASVVKENAALASKQRLNKATKDNITATTNGITATLRQNNAEKLLNNTKKKAIGINEDNLRQAARKRRALIDEKRSTLQLKNAELRLREAQRKADVTTQHHTKSWLEHISSVAGGIIVYQAIRSAMHGVLRVMLGSIKAVSDYQDSIIGVAAMYTTFAKDQSDIVKTYRLNKEYAEALVPVLMKIDKYTAMNFDQLMQVNQALATQGVALNLNNKEQIQGYTNIANAILFMTKGQASSRQIAQEVRAIMKGQAKASDALGRVLQSKLGPEYAKQIAQWKKMGELQGDSGLILEKIGKLLTGFTPATKDMENTWTAVTTSLQTTFNLLARESMTDVLADWVKYIKEFNKYLRENKKEIAGKIKQAWNVLKSVIGAVYKNIDKFKIALEAIIAAKILKGIFDLIKAFRALKIVSAALAVTIGTDLFIATGGLSLAFGAIMLTIDQLLDKTSWLNKRFETLSNTMTLFHAATKGDLSWGDFATAGPEEAAKMVARLKSNKDNNGIGRASDENSAFYEKWLKAHGHDPNKGRAAEKGNSMPSPLAGYMQRESGNHGKSDLENRTSMLMKWNDQLDREIKYMYDLTDAREVEIKLNEYNDRLKEKGLDQLDMRSGKEGDLLLKKLSAMQKEKQVGDQMRSMYDELRSSEKDWATAQDAVNRLLKRNNITVEESNRLLNKNAEAYEEAKNPIYDIIEGLRNERETIGLYGDALANAQFRLEVINALKEKGYDLSMRSAQGYLAEAVALREANQKAENNIWNKMEEAVISYGDTFASTMNDMVWGAKTSFKSILKDFLKMITEMVIKTQMIQPLLGGLFGGGGGVASATLEASSLSDLGMSSLSGVTPFANGGIVTKPTYFPMADGIGLRGEAGTEAVMPLSRTTDGKLGVHAVTPSTVGNQMPNIQVVVNNNTGSEISKKTETNFDGKNFVVTTTLEAIANNKSGMRDMIKMASKA